jgi:hypothetical protein
LQRQVQYHEGDVGNGCDVSQPLRIRIVTEQNAEEYRPIAAPVLSDRVVDLHHVRPEALRESVLFRDGVARYVLR